MCLKMPMKVRRKQLNFPNYGYRNFICIDEYKGKHIQMLRYSRYNLVHIIRPEKDLDVGPSGKNSGPRTSPDTCVEICSLMSMRGRASSVPDPVARTPIGVSGNFCFHHSSNSSLDYLRCHSHPSHESVRI